MGSILWNVTILSLKNAFASDYALTYTITTRLYVPNYLYKKWCFLYPLDNNILQKVECVIWILVIKPRVVVTSSNKIAALEDKTTQ